MKYVLLFLLSAAHLSATADDVLVTISLDAMVPLTGVVYMEGGKLKRQNARLDQKDKEFTEPLVAVTPGAVVTIMNSDDFEHNIFVDDQATGITFDLGVIRANDSFPLPIRWKSGTLVQLGCKIHPNMEAYVANIPSNHFAVIPFSHGQKQYTVTIADAPSDRNEVIMLLPGLEARAFRISQGESQPLRAGGREVGLVRVERVAGGG